MPCGTKAFCFVPRGTQKGAFRMSTEKIPYKIYLSEEELPRTWYNVGPT